MIAKVLWKVAGCIIFGNKEHYKTAEISEKQNICQMVKYHKTVNHFDY